MPFVSVYTTEPPVLSPTGLAGLPTAGTGLPDGTVDGAGAPRLNAPYLALIESSDGIDVSASISAGSASYCPYYWEPVAGIAHGGTWVPASFDALGGGIGNTFVTGADSVLHGGGCNGHYLHRPGKRYWILVRTAGMPTEVWAKVEGRRVVVEG